MGWSVMFGMILYRCGSRGWVLVLKLMSRFMLFALMCNLIRLWCRFCLFWIVIALANRCLLPLRPRWWGPVEIIPVACRVHSMNRSTERKIRYECRGNDDVHDCLVGG